MVSAADDAREGPKVQSFSVVLGLKKNFWLVLRTHQKIRAIAMR